MTPTSSRRTAALRLLIPALLFGATLFIRCRGISTHFWLLGDQIRDWSIVLGSFSSLPLVGPATHVGGYTIGPGFYWILWACRVVLGPFFENLPHAGGIGQAVLHSLGEALLLFAVWRRTQSVWLGLATAVLVATASLDLALSPVLWNPSMGAALAKIATALVVMEFYRASAVRTAVTTAVAWVAVHAYTGAIFVALSVFAALLVEPLWRKAHRTVARRAAVIAGTVALLQLPYVAHQIASRFQDPAMGALTDNFSRILSGAQAPRFAASLAGYTHAFNSIAVLPWTARYAPWIRLVCGVIVAVGHRRDPVLLTVTLAPQLAAIFGFAFFLGALDDYYYLSLMPAAMLTLVLGATTVPGVSLRLAVSVALLAAVLALVPARLRFAATIVRLPQYGVLVDASRVLVRRGQPLRAVRTGFTLPLTSDPEFLFRVLGGRIDRKSPWIAIISADGQVAYRKAGGP